MVPVTTARHAQIRTDNPHFANMTNEEWTLWLCEAISMRYRDDLGIDALMSEGQPYWVVDHEIGRLNDPEVTQLNEAGTHYVMYSTDCQDYSR